MNARDEVIKAREHLERAEAKLKSLERIRVPDEIEFREADDDCGMGLVFNYGRQELLYYPTYEQWGVGARLNTAIARPLYLEPCKRSDIEEGDWWVSHDRELVLRDFNLFLGDKSAYISQNREIHFANYGMTGNGWKVVQ